jgi:hypothetical protein
MSSTLSIINWAPAEITPTLNRIVLDPVPPSEARDNYYPNNRDVPRVAGTPPPGQPVWGAINNLTVKSTDTSRTWIYNSLAEPANARPNISLMLWVFPGYLIFSQIGEQLGPPVMPNG